MLKPTNYYELTNSDQLKAYAAAIRKFREIPYEKVERIARKRDLLSPEIYADPGLVRELVFEAAFDNEDIEREFFPE